MKKRKQQKQNQPYDLPNGNKFKSTKYVLGLDPGSRNFGIALVGLRDGKPKVYANSVLVHPVNDLINFPRASDEFMAEIARWMAIVPISGIVGERFQTRGNGGPLIEQVSAMLGLIRGRYPNIPIKLTVASAWKNKIRRRFDTDLRDIYPDVDVQPHQLDASLIGVFGLEAGLGQDLDYTLDDIIKQCEQTSRIDLKKRRSK